MKYPAPAMHETLTRVISQAHVQPILRPAGRSVVYIHPVYQPFLTDERPTRVRPEIVVSSRAENAAMLEPPVQTWDPRRCLDCRAQFTPRAGNHVRCRDCGIAERAKANLARKSTAITRKPKPRPRSAAVEKAMATRAIDAATRARARRAAPQQRRSA